jgi:2-dehydro-3-deoxyphosphogluconate aldolase/(4S)-4-hydroxy-2-oxoglutarate aldolase
LTREEVRKRIREIGLIPSIRTESAETAIFAAENVLAGGIPIVEVAVTTPEADGVIRELTRRFPTMMVGSEVGVPAVSPGTAALVATREEARRHLEAGASFLTGLGCDAEVVKLCAERETVVLPGAMTPTEIIHAYRAGADFIKVFPCSYIGGDKYIRALRAPLPHVPLVAAGGITQSTAANYIFAGAVALGVGEDLIPRRALRYREGAWIRELASRFLNFVRQARAQMGA